MCVTYDPVPRELVEEYFDAMPPAETWPDTAWPHYTAPFIVSRGGRREMLLGEYGFVPKDKEPPIPPKPGEIRAPGAPIKRKSLSTVNARAETVGSLKYYRGAWARAQLCLVPCTAFYEPNYETGKNIWHGIRLNDGKPFAVAGMWELWDAGTERERYTFTQLTINADDHPFMRRFHKPGDEKRSLVIVRPEDYDAWLECKNPEIARTFLQLYPSELLTSTPKAS